MKRKIYQTAVIGNQSLLTREDGDPKFMDSIQVVFNFKNSYNMFKIAIWRRIQ